MLALRISAISSGFLSRITPSILILFLMIGLVLGLCFNLILDVSLGTVVGLSSRARITQRIYDALLDFFGPPDSVDLREQPRPLVIFQQRPHRSRVNFQAHPHGIFGVVVALVELAVAIVAEILIARRIVNQMIHRSAVLAGPPPRDALYDFVIRHNYGDGLIELTEPALVEHRGQGLGLRHGTRKAVEDEASGGVGLAQPLLD